MSFCQLPESQVAALVFIKGIMASPKSPQPIKDLVTNRDWHTIAVAVAMSNPGTTIPTEGDFAAVGTMPQGLQDAHFLLAMIDKQGTDQARQQLQSALDTHCWDRVADSLRNAMSATGLQFSGSDLHQAYAPGDNSPCTDPGNIDSVLTPLVQSGALVGTFFSQSLPDFFSSGFGGLSNFFTGDFAGFFNNLGSQIGDGFEELGDILRGPFERVTEKVNPSNW